MWQFGIILAVILTMIRQGGPYENGCPHQEIMLWGLSELPTGFKNVVNIQKYLPNRTEGRKQKIPYFIYQTHQLDDIPYRMKFSINSLLEKNPEYSYRFFNAQDRRAFMQKYMEKRVLQAYNRLNPATYQADLFRYSILYFYGGCYLDTGFIAFDSFDKAFDENTTFMASPDGYPGNYYGVYTGIICAAPGHKILELTINSVVDYVKEGNYGAGPLDITGPQRLQHGFKSYIQDKLNSPVGPNSELYNKFQLRPGKYGRSVTMLKRFQGRPLTDEKQVCFIPYFQNENNTTILYAKYIDYYHDMSWYTQTRYYAEFYKDHTVFNKSFHINDYQGTLNLTTYINLQAGSYDFRYSPYSQENKSKN